MPSTYTLISSNVLASSAASVTFSAIPSTYTDLVLKTSVRTDEAVYYGSYYMYFNNSQSSNYSDRVVRGTGSTASSDFNLGNNTSISVLFANGASTTSNTFSNHEIYIPSYTASQNKPVGAMAATESNSSLMNTTFVGAVAGLWRVTNAITQIDIVPLGSNFVSGSSFYLYGIKNS